MPITQKTVLAIYGELCDLAETAEKLALMAAQGDLFTGRKAQQRQLMAESRLFFMDVQRAQRTALEAILTEEPEIDANPLTGRID